MLVDGERNEDEAHADSRKNVGPHHVPGGDLQVDVSKTIARVGQDEESKPDQQPRVDF
jgi:hypothetical protein